MKKTGYFFIAFIFLALYSCDEIDNPIPSNLGQTISGGDIDFIPEPELGLEDSASIAQFIDSLTWIETNAPDNSTQRFMVLEEFTGHECIFCPEGTREIVRLDGIYGDQLIPVGIHAGGFAVPRGFGRKFTTDFRPAGMHGEDYLAEFNPNNAYPRGMVNRINGASVGQSQWGQDISLFAGNQPAVVLKLTNYLPEDTATNIIRANMEIEWLQSLSEEYSLQVYLVEDHIVDWQKDGSIEIEDYDHRHVLRKVINDTFGKTLDMPQAGQKQNIQYIFSFDRSWKRDDLEVVAFIFNKDPSSYEIIQGNAAYVK